MTFQELLNISGPLVEEEVQRGLELGNFLSPKSDKALVKSFPLIDGHLLWRSLEAIFKIRFLLVFVKMVTFPFPLTSAGGFFSHLHYENLVGFLEVKPTKLWGGCLDWVPRSF